MKKFENFIGLTKTKKDDDYKNAILNEMKKEGKTKMNAFDIARYENKVKEQSNGK